MWPDTRRTVADDGFAHFGPEPVAADQGAALRLFAGGKGGDGSIAFVADCGDGLIVLQRDQIVPAACFKASGVNVGPVYHRVGLLEPLLGLLAKLDARDQLAGQRVAHLHSVGHPGVGQHRILQAYLVQGAKDVGAKLNAGAKLLELGGLLQHAHRESLKGQGIGRHQPADATADHQNRQIMTVRCHAPLPSSDTHRRRCQSPPPWPVVRPRQDGQPIVMVF